MWGEYAPARELRRPLSHRRVTAVEEPLDWLDVDGPEPDDETIAWLQEREDALTLDEQAAELNHCEDMVGGSTHWIVVGGMVVSEGGVVHRELTRRDYGVGVATMSTATTSNVDPRARSSLTRSTSRRARRSGAKRGSSGRSSDDPEPPRSARPNARTRA